MTKSNQENTSSNPDKTNGRFTHDEQRLFEDIMRHVDIDAEECDLFYSMKEKIRLSLYV